MSLFRQAEGGFEVTSGILETRRTECDEPENAFDFALADGVRQPPAAAHRSQCGRLGEANISLDEKEESALLFSAGNFVFTVGRGEVDGLLEVASRFASEPHLSVGDAQVLV
jgi:hypothetical protein